MHSYPSPQILHHMGKDLNFLPLKLRLILSLMGKESSFLPQKCNANLPHTGKESCFLPRMLKVHPSPGSASPQNATLPFPRGKDSSPFKMQNLHKSFPSNYFFVSSPFFFFFLIIIIFSFSPKLGILPQSEKVIPQRLGGIKEE